MRRSALLYISCSGGFKNLFGQNLVYILVYMLFLHFYFYIKAISLVFAVIDLYQKKDSGIILSKRKDFFMQKETNNNSKIQHIM